MEFVQLTETQRQEFEDNGYLIVRSAIDSEMIQRLTEAGDRLMDSFEYHNYYAHRRDGLVQEPAFADLATQSKAVPLILQLLGTISISRTQHSSTNTHRHLKHLTTAIGIETSVCIWTLGMQGAHASA